MTARLWRQRKLFKSERRPTQRQAPGNIPTCLRGRDNLNVDHPRAFLRPWSTAVGNQAPDFSTPYLDRSCERTRETEHHEIDQPNEGNEQQEFQPGVLLPFYMRHPEFYCQVRGLGIVPYQQFWVNNDHFSGVRYRHI